MISLPFFNVLFNTGLLFDLNLFVNILVAVIVFVNILIRVFALAL